MGTTTNHLLEQLVRLHRTIPGRRILDRIVYRTECRAALRCKRASWRSRARATFPTAPDGSMGAAPALCCILIPGINRKASAAVCVLKSHVEAHLEEFSGYMRVFTDEYVLKSGRFATAAFTISSLGVGWSGRLSNESSSTTAEVAAITEVMRVLTTLPPQDAAILTDSASAILTSRHALHY